MSTMKVNGLIYLRKTKNNET